MNDNPPHESGQAGKLATASVVCRLLDLLKSLDFPEDASSDPELTRRARLIFRFAVVGSIFGIVYAAFYFFIRHKWGVVIIVCCSSCFAATALRMRQTKSIGLAGHCLILILALGFTALCFVEGGLQGHAIAWLVSVPLCAHLLLGQKAAGKWVVVAFLAAGLVAGFELAGIRLPTTYNKKWEPIVSAAGYLGLIAFLFLLGLIFERGRARAFAKMQDAYTELAVANERLVHLNNEKNEFLGMAAHDLKNPLTVIVNSAEMVGMTDDENKIQKYLDNISVAAIRMRDMITDLLDVNAIEQGSYTSKVEACDLSALVKRSVEHNHSAAVKKHIEIVTGFSDGLWAKADPSATLQILDNLISNAVKYSPPMTTVHVHTLPETHYVMVAVRDEGPGISEADQKKLFQKYTRLTARPTGGESSTGLGLAIVKRLAEAMSGTIQCFSAPGGGATFTLRLPVSLPPPQILGVKAWTRHADLKAIEN